MSTKIIERELTDLKQRVERVERVIIQRDEQWRKVVGIFQNDPQAREAFDLGAKWRAKENKRR